MDKKNKQTKKPNSQATERWLLGEKGQGEDKEGHEVKVDEIRQGSEGTAEYAHEL